MTDGYWSPPRTIPNPVPCSTQTTPIKDTSIQLYYYISCLETENFISSSPLGESYAGKGPTAYLSLNQLLQTDCSFPVSLKEQSRMSPFLTMLVWVSFSGLVFIPFPSLKSKNFPVVC